MCRSIHSKGGIEMRKWTLLAACAALLCTGAGAKAETLTVSGVYPAASDEAIEVEVISVEQFGGSDGPRLSFLIEDHLRGVKIEGDPWFTVLAPQLAAEADGIMSGYVEPRISETRYRGTRTGCVRWNQEKDCIERGDVETDCLRVDINLDPQLRLVSLDGRVLWSSTIRRSHQTSFCPDYDDSPDFDPLIAGWMEEIASHVRFSIAPSVRSSSIRIMEGRNGLSRESRTHFRSAVALTETDEVAACDMFALLLGEYPEQPSLIFNTGLCAESDGDFAWAQDLYRTALASERSDDEAEAGLGRLAQLMRAERQLGERAILLDARYAAEPLADQVSGGAL